MGKAVICGALAWDRKGTERRCTRPVGHPPVEVFRYDGYAYEVTYHHAPLGDGRMFAWTDTIAEAVDDG